jgi:predicted metalloprotease with PDZ domain
LPRAATCHAWAKAHQRGLHHAAGADQPRVLPHLERQAPAPGRVRALRLHARELHALLWFFEGFTSYYDDLLLRRAGLLDDAAYLKLLNKTINQVMQTPGREVQSVAQASFDAWVKYYRQDENTPNATVSYYTKGALVALCFDLTLRRRRPSTLDAVMRALWARCKAGPMTEADFAAVLRELGGRAFSANWLQWVHGTRELPLRELLQATASPCTTTRPSWPSAWACAWPKAMRAIQVKAVLRGGAAENAPAWPAATNGWAWKWAGERLAPGQAGRPAALRRPATSR